MAVQKSLFENSKRAPATFEKRKRRGVAKYLDESILRLVNRILVGGVVPFLGAGLSLHCQTEEDGARIACTSVMTCNVCRAMREKPRCEGVCCNGEDAGCSVRRGLAQTCEEYVWRKTIRSLVLDVLRIKDFTRLQIAEAHRYIACLAREGLITEVITTNYDTSLERAYQESIGDSGPEATESISSLVEYRLYGAKVEVGRETPFLKVYHVNGCADDLDDGGSEKACESILLTERQLQDWGRRQWAKDLLRDRLRSKNILFSGFGSPEPQVRHTVLQIMEEFETGSYRELDPGRDPWSEPNAVYIHAYRNLTFEQKQILVSYALARRKKSSNSWKRNCFTGHDAHAFGLASCHRLSADAFWKFLFKRVFWLLLTEKWLSQESPYYYFLLRYASCVDILLQNTKDYILPPDDSISRYSYLSGFLDLEDGTMRLAMLLWRMRFRRLDVRRGWYAPLREKGILISAFFTICYLLEQLGVSFEHSEYCGPLGCGVRTKGTVLVCIAHSESAFYPGEEIVSASRDVNVVVQIIVDPEAQLDHIQVKLVDRPGGSSVRRVTVYQIPFGDLIRGREGSSNTLSDLINAVRTAIESPAIVLDRARRRRRYSVCTL